MNVKDYKYIVEISEQEGISRAADILCITQSALTKYLQRIEKELGVSLFYRKNNRLILTEAGQYYIEKGKKIINLDEEVEKGIAQIIKNREKSIRIGFSAGREQYIIQEILVPFFQQYPEVDIQLQIGSSSSRLNLVESNELDLALITSRDYRPGLNYYPVDVAYLVLAVPASSHLLEKAVRKQDSPYPVIALNEWINEPFIQLSSVTASGKMVREFFKMKRVQPRIRMEVNSVSNGVLAVESGLGNSVFWEVPIKNRSIEYLTLAELQPEPQRMYMAYRSSYCMPEAGKALLHLLRNTAK